MKPVPAFPQTTASPSLWHSLQTLNISRVIVAITLLAYLGLYGEKVIPEGQPEIFRNICIVYLLAAAGFVVLKIKTSRHFMAQLTAQMVFDLAIIAALYLGAGGYKSGLAILFLFPLAGCGILAPLLPALFFTSVATLFLLLEGVFHVLRQDEGGNLSQAGLFGAAFFSVVYVVNRLAGNLIRQEQLAAERGGQLAAQQAINRVVIADMGDGVVVLDQGGRLFEINPAAERMLGAQLSATMRKRPLGKILALRPMADALRARTGPQHGFLATDIMREEDASFVSIRCYADEGRTGQTHGERPHFMTHLKLRFVTVQDEPGASTDEAGGAFTIIFMQDVSDIENQAQQLKLASMGRLTASIAHEVRNPLSSISYAASLLNEDVANDSLNKTQAERLLRIVDVNVGRLNQLIEDILKLSRKAHPQDEPFSVIPVVIGFVHDFAETRNLAPEMIAVDENPSFPVTFDTGHLREIIVNLLSNAIRYASGKPGSIRIYASTGPGERSELHIQDDGPGIAYDVRSHLFEPFYTTSHKGTGLGLYMARELCLNNHALLDYEYRSDTSSPDGSVSGRFVINFSGYSA